MCILAIEKQAKKHSQVENAQFSEAGLIITYIYDLYATPNIISIMNINNMLADATSDANFINKLNEAIEI